MAASLDAAEILGQEIANGASSASEEWQLNFSFLVNLENPVILSSYFHED
jgi:hypothetical protein